MSNFKYHEMYFFPNKPRLFSVLTQPHCHSMGYFLLEKNSFRQQHSAKKILIYIIAFFRLFYFLKIALKRHSILYIQKRKIFCLKSVKRLVCPEKKMGPFMYIYVPWYILEFSTARPKLL